MIRRTDTFWAGISSDLAIEQALMKNTKTTGGLTRGRGMSENQRALWILSRSNRAEMNDAMQTFTGTNYYSSDQHKEDGKSHKKRDKGYDDFRFLSRGEKPIYKRRNRCISNNGREC